MIGPYLRLQNRLLYNRLFKGGKRDLGILFLVLFVVLANMPMAALTLGALQTGFAEIAAQQGLDTLQRMTTPAELSDTLQRIENVTVRTPMRLLSEEYWPRPDVQVSLKLECEQVSGSFKARGARHFVARLLEREPSTAL